MAIWRAEYGIIKGFIWSAKPFIFSINTLPQQNGKSFPHSGIKAYKQLKCLFLIDKKNGFNYACIGIRYHPNLNLRKSDYPMIKKVIIKAIT